MRRALAPLLVVTLFLVALQLSVFSSWRLSGVVVMLVWLWPFCVGLTGVTSLALVTALVAGVFFDTHSSSPFGLSAVVALLVAYAASRLGREGVGDLDSAAWWVTPALGAAAGFGAPLLFCVAGFFELNFSLWRGSVLAAMVVNAVAFFVLARPLTRVAFLVTGQRGRARS